MIAFLSDSDWHWSGQAQRKTGILAETMANGFDVSAGYMKVYLGSRFTYEVVGARIEDRGYEQAREYFSLLISE